MSQANDHDDPRPLTYYDLGPGKLDDRPGDHGATNLTAKQHGAQYQYPADVPTVPNDEHDMGERLGDVRRACAEYVLAYDNFIDHHPNSTGRPAARRRLAASYAHLQRCVGGDGL